MIELFQCGMCSFPSFFSSHHSSLFSTLHASILLYNHFLTLHFPTNNSFNIIKKHVFLNTYDVTS